MSSTIYDPAFWSRFQFGFTLTYHYLFPQLTMGFGVVSCLLEVAGLRTDDEKYNRAVRFWAKIFRSELRDWCCDWYFVFISPRYAEKVSVKRDNQGFY